MERGVAAGVMQGCLCLMDGDGHLAASAVAILLSTEHDQATLYL